MSKLRLISGRAHLNLAKKIAEILKIGLTPVEIKNFASGEIYFRIKEKVRDDDVFLIQTLSPPVNEHLLELLIAIDALKRASVGRINVVCPYLAYTRQDRKSVSREPITAKLVANLISKAGADRLLTVDLHTDQIQGFYDIPLDHFVGYPQFAEYFLKKKYQDLVIVSPDVGGVVRGRRMARLIQAPLAIIDKRRPVHQRAEILNLIGEVKGKTAVVIDDIIDTAGTITQVAQVLKKEGAKKVIICATHGLLSKDACQKLEKSPASEVLLLDTLPLPKEKKTAKIKILSLAPLLAKVIKRIHRGWSLGALFTWEKK
jgi:ribose-phosphate pyrophosphokinase